MSTLKYATTERERRWLLRELPDLRPRDYLDITDRYLPGSRLRLREVVAENGDQIRKLGHKVRLGEDAGEIACTNLYLDEGEWELLSRLDGHLLTKRRRRYQVGDQQPVVDVFGGHCGGLIMAEVDSGSGAAGELPDSFAPVAEVTDDERFTGGELAAASRESLLAALAEHGLGRA